MRLNNEFVLPGGISEQVALLWQAGVVTLAQATDERYWKNGPGKKLLEGTRVVVEESADLPKLVEA